MQNFSYLLQGEYCQIEGWMEGVGKTYIFNR